MPQRRFSCCETKAKDVRDVWECRYVISELPLRFKHKELKKVFDKWDRPFTENDLYFIADDTNVNIKLRKLKRPKPTIKVKMFACKYDEFEFWCTEIDEKLPAPAEVWSEVLARLDLEDDIELLSRCSKPDQVEEVLISARSNLPHIETWKRRRFYGTPAARVEVVKVTIGSSLFYSVAFESESRDLTQVRAIRDKLLADDLGTPTSYVSLLSQITLKNSTYPEKLAEVWKRVTDGRAKLTD